MSSTYKKYASVLLDIGLKGSFTYGLLDEHLDVLKKGMCVKVPLRGVMQTGIIVDFSDQCAFKKVLPISEVVSEKALMNPELFRLAEWMSQYYHSPLSKAVKLFFPKSVRKGMGYKKQQAVSRSKTKEEIRAWCEKFRHKRPKQVHLLDEVLKVEKEILLTELLEKTKASRSIVQSLVKSDLLKVSLARVERNPLKDADYFPSKPKTLNSEQQAAFESIEKSIGEGAFKSFLLFGVTGSGKTEIYMQAMEKAIQEKKEALLLVPEIALTTQTVEKLKTRFKDKIAVLHHRLSDGERYDQWHSIASGQSPIVVGARSAVFAPLKNIGLIIVDEEHEQSYKQTDDSPTYNARDLAVLRAQMNQATVVLGSATPSLESFSNVEKGKYDLLKLTERVNQQRLPEIEIIDMKSEMEKTKGFTLFSSRLLKEIKLRFEKGEQSLIFLNRRGFHTSVICTSCGEVEKCSHCDLALTFHRKKELLSCHLCDYHIRPPSCCRSCGSPTMKFKGYGTENVESQLKKVFPEIRTLRMDADTTKHVGSYEKLYYDFRNHKADVLIGTQMIAKGLHFPSVTLVGVLNCDRQFNIPDFRGAETGFQMITQVAGRAGRGEVSGLVLLQCFQTQNTYLSYAIEGNYEAFYQKEIESRKFFNFPPYVHLIRVLFKGPSEEKTLAFAKDFYTQFVKECRGKMEVMSPLACGYPKINDQYRFQVIIKTKSVYGANECLGKVERKLKRSQKIKMLIDVDPSSTFF